MEVTVVGAGVSGLTCAVRLAEAGLRVLVRGDEPPERTTSCTAGAMWDPHLVSHERAEAWALASLSVFRALTDVPEAAVRLTAGIEAARGALTTPPPRRGAADITVCEPSALPPGFTNGWRYRVPVIDMRRYLPYLTRRLLAAGGRLEIGAPVTAAELPALAPLVINCAGLGAIALTGDDAMTPVRGDLLAVANPGLDTFFVEHDDDGEELTTYILPQGPLVNLGGSRRRGDWSLAPDPAVAEEILRRCSAAEPRLSGSRLIEHRVGLRPVRTKVRLERDTAAPSVIHNYGHGGAGVTLSWGCADEVLALSGGA